MMRSTISPLRSTLMQRWGLSCIASRYLRYVSLCALVFVSLEVASLKTARWIAPQSARSTRRVSCKCLATDRGQTEPRSDTREVLNGVGPVVPCSRKDMLKSMGLIGSAVVCGQALAGGTEAADLQDAGLPTVGKITKSGIKYFDYWVGEGETPRWGQDCVIRFTMYGRSAPDEKLIKIQSSDNNKEDYLFKHGNGFQIKGMEEGLHSMKVGGRRRIIIPQELGYTVQGLGPYPADPRKRDVLIKVLTSFENTKNGELVMDIDLLDAFEDEADQGYYEDQAVTPEQLQDLVQETGQFSGGVPFEKLPGQLAPLMEDTSRSGLVKGDGRLPGQLGKDVQGG